MSISVLYFLTVFIWGTTWLVITFQLGVVSPSLSVAYRFLLAGVLLLSYCAIKKEKLRLSRQEHLRVFSLGIFIFCLNYLGTYYATQHLPSGLVSVVFSGITGLNIINSWIFLRQKTQKRVMAAAFVGFVGIAFVFSEDLKAFDLNSTTMRGLAFALWGALMASFGNIISASNQKKGISIMVSNGFGMLYGGASTFAFALMQGAPLVFDFRWSYILSLLYLSVFGSIIAFGAYFELLKSVGPSRASYAAILFPVVALALSTVFENYRWHLMPVIGVALILLGNLFILQRKPK
ncbi:MAG: EamA family transporter [Oligoflexia bacterium]|nr:EamA family transporter [Oligoflexia bacterium]